MSDVVKNANVNITGTADAGNIEAFRGTLEGIAKAGQKAGDGASQGLSKASTGATNAAKGLKVLENQLNRMQAEALAMGDSVTAAVLKAQFKNPNTDFTGMNAKVEETRRVIDAENRRLAIQKSITAEMAAQNREAVNLSKQIQTATIRAEQGMASSSPAYYRNLMAERGITPSSRDEMNLTRLENAQQMQQRVNAVTRQTNALVTQQENQIRSITSAMQREISSLTTANMTVAERYKYQIQQAGLNVQQFQPMLSQLQLLEANALKAKNGMNGMGQAMMKNGMTMKQYQANLRGVPAQITDIVVSLQGGQRPLTVLLQQGGQLKDMFNGVVPAVKALGTTLLGMINPITVAGTALGVLGVAMYQGADESQKLQQALIATGNASGMTRDQLQSIVDSIGEVSGQYGKAAEAALAFTRTTADLDTDTAAKAIQAIADITEITGETADKVAEKFNQFADKPVDAVMKLNEGLNFMDVATLKTIASLEKQGRTSDAARIAIERLSDATRARAAEIVANAGWIERSWYAVRNAILSAWDALKGFGRAQSAGEEIKEIESRLASYRNRTDAGAAQDIRIAEQNLALAKERAKTEERAAKNSQAQAKAVQSYYKGYQAAQKKSGSGRKRSGRGGGSKTNPEVSEYENLTKSIQQRTEAIRLELKYGDKLTEAEKLRIQIENNSVNSKKKLTKAHQEALLAQVATLRELEKQKYMSDYQKKWDEDTRKFNRTFEQQIAVIGMGAEQAALYKKQMDVMATAEEKHLDAQRKGIDDGTAQKILDDASERVKLMEEQKRLLQEEYNDPWKALTESIRTYREEAENTGKLLRDAFKDSFSSMEDAFVQFTTTGKLSFSDLVNSILQDIARMMAKKAVNNFLGLIMDIGGSALSSWLGGNTTGGGGTQVKDSYSDFSYRGSGVSFRASGGPVYQDNPYIVGEQGPELFVPASTGKIVSNDDLTGKNGLGMGGFNIQISHRNEGTQQQVTDSGADFDGKNLIIKIVTQDIANDGQISRTMSRTFGMRRAAGAM